MEKILINSYNTITIKNLIFVEIRRHLMFSNSVIRFNVISFSFKEVRKSFIVQNIQYNQLLKRNVF